MNLTQTMNKDQDLSLTIFHEENIIYLTYSCSSEVGIEDLEYGWCFLENIVDPANPQNGCHEDVQWSEVDGRFWSNIACFEENQEPHECLSTLNNPCIFPFSYNEVTHEKCTHVGSENGAAWCATEIDSEGKVVTNKWEDCQASCPVE